MVEVPLVVRKMALISADLKEIRALVGRPAEDYLGDLHSQVRAERYLERVIGRMVDINFHLITTAGHAPPRDYYDSFTRLICGLHRAPARLGSSSHGAFSSSLTPAQAPCSLEISRHPAPSHRRHP
jgi:hypothetical protein